MSCWPYRMPTPRRVPASGQVETFPPEFPQITSSFLFYLPHERRADFLQPDALFKFCDNKGSPNFLKRLPEVMLVKAAPDGESEAEPACQLTSCNCCLTLGESVQVVRFAARSLLLPLHSQHLSGLCSAFASFFSSSANLKYRTTRPTSAYLKKEFPMTL